MFVQQPASVITVMTANAGARDVDAHDGAQRPSRVRSRPGAIGEGEEIRYAIRTPTVELRGTGRILKIHRKKGRVHSYVVAVDEDRMILVFPDEIRR